MHATFHEVYVTLHTAAGLVVTCYPVAKLAEAMAAFAQYVADGKRVTLEYI